MEDSNKKELIERVDSVLSELRPHLWADEGDVKIIDINEKLELVVQWQGACVTCSLSSMTLKYGLKHAVMEQIDEITDVIIG